MCPGPRLKKTFALLNATLTRVQALFSIRGTRRIAAFSTRMRFWRDTPFAKPNRPLRGATEVRRDLSEGMVRESWFGIWVGRIGL
jgi:hypothetical protein